MTNLGGMAGTEGCDYVISEALDPELDGDNTNGQLWKMGVISQPRFTVNLRQSLDQY